METLFIAVYAIVVLLILGVGSAYTYFHYKHGVGSAPSSKKARKVINAEIADLMKTGSLPQTGKPLRIIDFGSGSGGLVRSIAKSFPGARVTGIDISPMAHAAANIWKRILGPKNCEFVLGGIHQQNIGEADIVVSYLTGRLQNEFSKYFHENLHPDVALLCISWPMPDSDWNLYKTLETGDKIEPAVYCHRRK